GGREHERGDARGEGGPGEEARQGASNVSRAARDVTEARQRDAAADGALPAAALGCATCTAAPSSAALPRSSATRSPSLTPSWPRPPWPASSSSTTGR